MRKLFIIAIIALVTLPSQAQRWKLKRYEAIAGVGFTNVFGDIGGYTVGKENLYGLKDLRISTTRPSFYLGGRYRIRENMSSKVNIAYARAFGNDEVGSNEGRGGEFKTTLIEISGQYEYYFLKEDRKLKSSAVFNRRGMINNYAKIAAYTFAGGGGIFFVPSITLVNPSPNYETLKNNFQISGVGFAGLGLKYTVDSKFIIGFELGGRYSFSDFIDGFSSDFSKFNDIYYFGVVSLNYKIRNDKSGRPILFR